MEVIPKKNEELSKNLGIVGLILGIICLFVSFIPCFGLFAFFIGVLGIIFSGIALALALRDDFSTSLIIAGLACSIIGCGMAYMQYRTITDAAKEIVKEGGLDFNELKESLESLDSDEIQEEIEKASKEIQEELKNVDTEKIQKEIEKASKEIQEEIRKEAK